MWQNARMRDNTENHIRQPFALLEQIYARHEKLLEKMDLACRIGCDSCCTRNVTVTSLEADSITRYLAATDTMDLLENLETAKELPRFQPLTTTNTLAHLCRNGKVPPEETCDPAWRPCPLLKDHRCSIYAARPFACRCMVSKSVCRHGGQAEIDDFLLAIHTVFMQFIEHADASGCTGNLIDMLPLTGHPLPENGFIPNRPIEMILLPPEYQARGHKIVTDLSELLQ
jgi:Fe-S-cluster containining protein